MTKLKNGFYKLVLHDGEKLCTDVKIYKYLSNDKYVLAPIIGEYKDGVMTELFTGYVLEYFTNVKIIKDRRKYDYESNLEKITEKGSEHTYHSGYCYYGIKDYDQDDLISIPSPLSAVEVKLILEKVARVGYSYEESIRNYALAVLSILTDSIKWYEGIEEISFEEWLEKENEESLEYINDWLRRIRCK